MKRGQITVFIIIGLILLLVIGLVVYFTQRGSKSEFEQAKSELASRLPGAGGGSGGVGEDGRLALSDLSPRPVIEYCFEKLSREGVYLIAKQGGYLNPKSDYRYLEPGDLLPAHFYGEDAVVPYVVHTNTTNLRPFGEVLDQLARYVAVNADSCIDFGDANSSGFTVRKPNIDWEGIGFDYSLAVLNYSSEPVSFDFIPRSSSQDLVLDASYPVEVEGPDFYRESSGISVEVPLRLQRLHSLAGSLAGRIADIPEREYFELEPLCGSLAANDDNINVYVSENELESAYLVTLVDAKPVELGLPPLRFQFAVRNKIIGGSCIG